MFRFMPSGALAALLVLITVAPVLGQEEAAGPHLPPDSMEIGRQYADWFLVMEVDSLHAHMTEEMQGRRSPDEMFDMMTQMFTQVGEPGDMLSERYVMRNGMPQYWYTTEFASAPEPVQIRFVITPDGPRGPRHSVNPGHDHGRNSTSVTWPAATRTAANRGTPSMSTPRTCTPAGTSPITKCSSNTGSGWARSS